MLVVVPGCTLTREKQAIEQPVEVNKVWPQKPAMARIAYVKSFASAADLGIDKGFFARIADFFTGKQDWHLVRPMAVLATNDGKIYVADPGSGAVHRFDKKNGKYTLILASDKQALPSPIGLAIGAKGEVYITDSFLGQIYVVPAGSDTAEILKLVVTPDQPTNIVVDAKSQRRYVVDSARHHIKVYGPDGLLLNTIGRRGDEDGEFNFPSMIWLDNQNRLLVSDALNFRIQMFDLDGHFIKKFGQRGDGTGDMSRPKGVATDSYGHIYVVDALFHSVQVFNDSGEFLLNVGHRGNAAGEFLLPTGIYITRDNMIYVADSHNSRVQVFRYIGDRP
jgi:DNA-binding beta-propeller fold protein YncE